MDDRDINRGPWFFGISLTVTIIAVIGILLRWYTRYFLTRSLGSDDFAMIIPLCSIIGGEVMDIYNIVHGMGRHATYLSPENVEMIRKDVLIAWLRAFLTYFFLRASVLLFTSRLLPHTKKIARRITYGAFFLNFAITLIACVLWGIRCTPFYAGYTNIAGGRCKSEQILVVSMQVNGALSCIIDITTAFIPVFLLWDLQIKKRTKIVLNIIFFLGLLTAGLSIARAATTHEDTFGPDLPFTQCIPGITSVVEIALGAFFASCPILRQLVAYIHRYGTILPTEGRNPPDQDFIAMRKRVTLRDIFWYRRRLSGDISLPSNAPPQKPRDISDADSRVNVSVIDRVWRGLGKAFGVSGRNESVQPDNHSLSNSEKGLVGAGAYPLGENAPTQGSRLTFLLSATRNESVNGSTVDDITSSSSR